MKFVLILCTIIGCICLSGCGTCNCGCPYCCNGSADIDYSNPSNKPAADIPIWWKENN